MMLSDAQQRMLDNPPNLSDFPGARMIKPGLNYQFFQSLVDEGRIEAEGMIPYIRFDEKEQAWVSGYHSIEGGQATDEHLSMHVSERDVAGDGLHRVFIPAQRSSQEDPADRQATLITLKSIPEHMDMRPATTPLEESTSALGRVGLFTPVRTLMAPGAGKRRRK